MPGLALAHFLGAAMVVADVGHRIDHHLPVQLQGDAEHPVHAGVIGAQIEEHELGVAAGALHAPFLRPEAQRLLLLFLAFLVKAERLHLGGAGGVFLAQGVALPGGGQQDAPQVGVAAEADAEHVPGFPLVPVGVGPHADRSGHFVRLDDRHLDAELLHRADAEQVIDHAELGGRLPLPMLALALVDAEQVVEHGVAGLQVFQHGQQLVRWHPHRGDAVRRHLLREPGGAEAGD